MLDFLLFGNLLGFKFKLTCTSSGLLLGYYFYSEREFLATSFNPRLSEKES
jgi:hypothetical protein